MEQNQQLTSIGFAPYPLDIDIRITVVANFQVEKIKLQTYKLK
jgi:hypothetical protein